MSVVVVAQSLSYVQLLWPHGLQQAGLPCSSLSPRVCLNSCPLSWWCHPTISSSVTPLSSCHQSFLASGSFPGCWFFTLGGQRIGALASALVLPMNIQGWFPLGLTGLVSSQGTLKSFLHHHLQFSHSVVSDSLRPHESQHTRPPCPSPTPGVYSNPCPSHHN